MKLTRCKTRRIATVHTNQRDHIPLAYRQFTKLPSYVTSCMLLHDDDDVYYYIRWRLKLEGETARD